MRLLHVILVPVKTVALAVVMCVVFVVAASSIDAGSAGGSGSSESGAADPGARQAAQLRSAGALLGACAIQAVALAYFASRSRLGRWALAGALGGLFFVTMGAMAQSETALFFPGARGLVPRLLMVHLVVAAVAGTGAAVLFGGRGPTRGHTGPLWRPARRDWLWLVSALSLTYLAVYLVAGYCFVWTHSEAREFYGGGGPRSLASHVIALVRESPGFLLFQLVRGAVWGGIAYGIVAIWGGRRWEVPIALVLFLSLAFAALLLVPNPFLPGGIRTLHFYEVIASNTVFALVAGWLLTRRVVAVAHPVAIR